MTMRIYLDAAPIIYTIEQVTPFAERLEARLRTPGITLITSDLARLECRVKPIRLADIALLKDFDDYFASAILEMIMLTREVIDRATEIRARFSVRTPDAIHLAAAELGGCDIFLTNDHRLDRYNGLSVETV
jgi:predicted nucleic acid-binding protein